MRAKQDTWTKNVEQGGAPNSSPRLMLSDDFGRFWTRVSYWKRSDKILTAVGDLRRSNKNEDKLDRSIRRKWSSSLDIPVYSSCECYEFRWP